VQYAELRERPDTVRHLIAQWHESIGESLLHALQLPEHIVASVRDHDQPREPMLDTPRNLSELVYAANAMAGGSIEWTDNGEEHKLGELYTALADRVDARFAELKQDYAA
jgi:HD-like signal output (HDOD) protein